MDTLNLSRNREKKYFKPRKLEKKGFITELFPEFEAHIHDRLHLALALKEGVSVEQVNRFISVSGLTQSTVAEKLGLAVKTLHDYKKTNKALPPEKSEKLIKLIELYDKGIEVIGSGKGFINWLNTPAYGLGWVVPETLLSSIAGIEAIMDELNSIAFGDFS
jgi:putative toxin-antitoxin system antitoxin component (TIGR02293 family)